MGSASEREREREGVEIACAPRIDVGAAPHSQGSMNIVPSPAMVRNASRPTISQIPSTAGVMPGYANATGWTPEFASSYGGGMTGYSVSW